MSTPHHRGRLLVAVALAVSASPFMHGAQAPATAPPSVDTLVAEGLKKAQAETKTVFVEFGASWCAPCLRMNQFLEAAEVQPIIARHFVLVPITVWETGRNAAKNNPGGEQLIKQWGGTAIPFYAFLGPAGAPVRDSRDVGFPESNGDIGAFVDLLSRSAPRMSSTEKTALSDHLTAGAPAMGWNVIAARRVWSEDGFSYRPAMSADGRFVAYTDFGGVFLHDIARNTTRQVNLPASAKDGVDGDVYDQPAISKDGRFLAVSYVVWFTGHRDLRVVPIDATAVPERPLFSDPAVEWIRPHEWTADGKWILVELKRKESAEIGMVSTVDGSLKVLKRVKLTEIADDANYTGAYDTNIMQSPDGQYIAFDLNRDDDDGDRDIFLMRLADGKESPAVTHIGDDGVFGWTPDGANLFFMSNRTGEYALWVAPVKDGVVGDPAVVKTDVGEVTTIGVLPNGALLYAPQVTAFRDVWALDLDFATGARLSAPREYVSQAVGKNSNPSWSPDGRELYYSSSRGGRDVLIAQTIATGATRQVQTEFTGSGRIWAPDGKSFAVLSGMSIQRVDAFTGQATELVKGALALRAFFADRILFERSAPAEAGEPQLAIVERELASGREREVFRSRRGGANRLMISPDGRTLYHRRPVPANRPPHDLVARDLRTGTERVILSQRPLGSLDLSPDGRFIITPSTDPTTRTTQVLLIPTAGGSAPRVLRIDEGLPPNLVVFAPDSNSMLASRSVKGIAEYWWVPFDDRQARRIEFPAAHAAQRTIMMNAQVSPDGRTVTYGKMTVLPSAGVWVMEFERRGR